MYSTSPKKTTTGALTILAAVGALQMVCLLLLVGCDSTPTISSGNPPGQENGGYSSPVPISQDSPKCSGAILQASPSRQVIVNLVVGRNGQVNMSFIVSPLNPVVDDPVLDAVKRWKFKPGSVNGRPVNVDLQLPIDFEIDGKGNVGTTIGHDVGYPNPELMVPDVNPKPILQVSPSYPLSAREAKAGGTVVVDFLVTTNGDVRQASALRSNNPEFEASALDAVRKWRFEPGTRNGMPITCHKQVPIVFDANDQR